MLIYVNVKPGSKQEKFEKISENEYKIALKEKAIDGKANIALIKLLAKELEVNFQSIKIKNPSSRKKIIEINK